MRLWSFADVLGWMEEVGLPKAIKESLDGFRGKQLAQLCDATVMATLSLSPLHADLLRDELAALGIK